MNYNHQYANYQTPNSAGYVHPNGSPIYAPNGQYAVPPQGLPQVALNYGQYPNSLPPPPQAYSNPYQQPAPSPQQQVYSNPMLVIPQQRVPQSHPTNQPNSNPSPVYNQNYHQRPPQHHPQQHPQQQNQWQQYHQQQASRPVQYQVPPTYPSHNPTITSHRTAMVEIPIPAQRPQQSSSHKQPPAKPQQISQPKQEPQSRQSSSTSSHIQHVPKAVKVEEPPPDFQQLLLSLADEYISAAHGMGSMVALYRRAADMDEYYKLMATGLGCMESALTNFRLLPRQEALLTLQYANLMFTETENYDEIEMVLTKAIALCDRNKLLDLKYSMHHLLARALFKTKPRAAFKSLETLIPDVEAYQQLQWVYAFRFLRTTLSLEVGDSHEIAAAIHHLRSIQALSESRGDDAIFVVAATLEAMVHLRSSSQDSVEQTQRAIAAARSLQLQSSVKDLTQVWALLDCIDLSCSLLEYNPDQAAKKAETMQNTMDAKLQDLSWREDGQFAVPLESHPSNLTESTSGIFERINGKDHLMFSWLPSRDSFTLGYLLSGIAAQTKSNNEKRAVFLMEGIKMIQENFDASSLEARLITPQSCSLPAAEQRIEWWHQMEWYLNLYLTFMNSSKCDWTSAQARLDKTVQASGKFNLDTINQRRRWTTYLTGVIKQGLGDTDAALQFYQDPILALPPATSNRVQEAQSDLSILAAMNTLLIIRNPKHPQHYQADSLMDSLLLLTAHHTNKSLVAAMALINSILKPSSNITTQKRSVQDSLNNARHANNNLLQAATMTVMSFLFFKDIVGEQSGKSIKAARLLSQRAGSNLWTATAEGMNGVLAGKQGDNQEVAISQKKVQHYVQSLPKKIKEELVVEHNYQG